MKRALHGMTAFSSLIAAALPEKTKTYTPISHNDIISQIRTEINKAGYKIINENYRSSNEGQVALGSFEINFKEDPDIALTINFVNSYNKQYAFRFHLGAVVKINKTGMMLDKFGYYKRVHKGEADVLSSGKMSDFIKDSGSYWDAIVEDKELFKKYIFDEEDFFIIIGKMFFKDGSLNTLQLNQIDKEFKNLSFDYTKDNAWMMYKNISLALKESRPATWMDDQISLHAAFTETLNTKYGVVSTRCVRLETSSDEPEKVIDAPLA